MRPPRGEEGAADGCAHAARRGPPAPPTAHPSLARLSRSAAATEAHAREQLRRLDASFGDAPTRAFNAIVAGIAAGDPVNLLLLDAYAATVGQLSVDGVHYGHESNAVLAQIMLNILDSL